MSLQEKLSQLCNGLISDKVTERKKCTETLKEFLAGSGIPSLLTENHRKNSGISWNGLFSKVHELITKEAEKLSSGKGVSTHDTVKIQCSSLFISVVTGANRGKCFISPGKVVECCTEAFKCPRILKHFGETYTTVLMKHVLQVPHYLNMFSPYQWADLLEGAVELHKESCIEKSTVAKLVCCVLEEGTLRCQLALAVRESLPDIGAMFLINDMHRHHHMQENLLRIAICIVNNIGGESRLAVCHFTEAILPSVIQFYEQSSDIVSNKKKLLFSLLELCLVIHHPTPGASLAGSWSSWLQILHNIRQVVRAEATALGNSIKRLGTQRMSEICPSYIALAVQVYHLVFSESMRLPSDVDEPSNPPKRMRIESSDVASYITLLQHTSITNCYPGILIVASYFNKHSTQLSSEDHSETIAKLSTLLEEDNGSNLNRSSLIIDAVALVCQALSKKEDVVASNSSQLITVWNACSRKSTETVLFDKCHGALQSLLKLQTLDLPLESLLKMYCERNIPGQRISLYTLHIILSYHNYKILDKNLRTSLVQWVLNSCLPSVQCQNMIPMVLFQTCINDNIIENSNTNDDNNLMLQQFFEDVRYLILKSDFENGLLNNQNIVKKTVSKEKCVTVLSHVIEFVLCQLSDCLQTKSNTTTAIKQFSVMLQFISLCEKYKIFDQCRVLLNVVKVELRDVYTQLPQHITSITQISKNLLDQLSIFYSNKDYSEDVFKMICEETSTGIITNLCNMLNDCEKIDLNDSMELMDVDGIHKEDSEVNSKMKVFNILINYCVCDTSFKEQVLEFILGPDLYDFSNPQDFENAVNVLEFIIGNFTSESIPIGAFLQVLQEMCKKLYRDSKSSKIILHLLYGILETVRSHGTQAHRENVAIMVNSFLSRGKEKFYTPAVMGQTLLCISKIDASGVTGWNRHWEGYMIQSLSNTIHSIRLFGCYCLGYEMKDASHSKFSEMISALSDVFLIDERDLPENVISDESANRTSTALHCLSHIAICSPIWDVQALAELIKMSYRKRLSPILVGKVFQHIAKYYNIQTTERLVASHLEFFVYCWLQDGLSLEDFPYYLLLCETKNEFFYKYRHSLVPYDMLWSGRGERCEVVRCILENNASSVDEIYMECLPQTLALIVPHILHDRSLNTSWNPSSSLISSAKTIYSTLCNSLGEGVVTGCVTTHPVTFLKGLLRHLCDEEELRTDMKWTGTLPHMVGPVLSTTAYSAILNWFNKKLNLEILFHLCCDSPSSIQEILLYLWGNIERQTTEERKLLGLHQYWKFCQSLPLLTNLKTFISQFITQSLLHIIEQCNGTQYLAVATCRMMYYFIKKFLPDLADVVSKMLCSIAYTISRAVTTNDEIKEPAMGLLLFLVIDMGNVLSRIQYLDPFPDLECFKKLNNTLKSINATKNDTLLKQIESFLEGGLTGRFEGLKLLHNRLASSPIDLLTLYNDLSTCRGFSEECKDSILHRLTNHLLHIAANKDDLQCSRESVRCLGVLGVADYQSLSIQPPPPTTPVLSLSPLDLLALHALQHLPSLCMAAQPEVCEAAAAGIRGLLKYKEGIVALDSLAEDNNHFKDIKILLIPFISPQKCWPGAKVKVNNVCFEEMLALDVWTEGSNKTYNEWLTQLVMGILKSFNTQQCFLVDLIRICEFSLSFCESVIPSLVGLVFCHGTEHQIKGFCQRIRQLFSTYFAATYSLECNEPAQERGGSQVLARKSVECLLEIVKFLFIQKKHYPAFSKTSALSNFHLDLVSCSWAACSVGHYLSAVYYVEMCCMMELDQQLPSSPELIAALPSGTKMLSILKKCYECMHESAALSGCGTSHLLDPSQRRQHYLTTGSYAEALLMHDCDLTSHTQVQSLVPELSFARSLQTAGLYQLTGKYLESLKPSQEVDAIKYDCCWRLSDWSLQVDSSQLKSQSSAMSSLTNVQSVDGLWPAYHYMSLKGSISRGTEGGTWGGLVEAREYVAVHCMQTSLESSRSVYQVCAKLQMLREIEYFTQVRCKYSSSDDIVELHSLLSAWGVDMLPPLPSFDLLEDLLYQRCVMLQALCSSTHRDKLTQVVPAVVELILQYSDLALREGCHQLSVRWVTTARGIVSHMEGEESGGERGRGMVVLAEGRGAWQGGHHSVAQHLLKAYIAGGENHRDNSMYAGALRLYGSWMVESRSESALDILDKYLTKSLQVLGPRGDPKQRLHTYITIAKFSDGEYKQVDTYMKSAAFVSKIKCMEQCKVKADSLRVNESQAALTKDERKAMFLNNAQSRIDQIEITNTKTERNYYLQLAIKYYLTTLIEGDTDDLCIFRVISLWLDNPTLELVSKQTSRSLADLLKSIPSRKLLPVISQLAPRLNCVDSQPHHKLIYELIEKCLLEHPHHVLPVLLALKNSYKDVEYSADALSMSQAKAANDAYVETAKRMLNVVVKKGDKKIVNIIRETEQLSLALISLANYKITNPKTMEMKIPASEPIKKLKNLHNALIPTVTIPVRADCNYEEFPSVGSFSDKFLLVGGINMPKKLSCVGSDGVQRPCLLKGEDDIRQDAVMQQVFVIVNQLLASHQNRDTRKLLIRTYKVVALSRRSGIIEWCDGTEPLGRLLVGANNSSGLHGTMRPGDISSKEARKMMDEKRTATNEEKLKVFRKILSRLKPVLHHFFFQQFLVPSVWYERKLAYTQSVATSSMIGYILGLGDRHVQNILVDKSTAEVVHIDLGIAFEQGRVQPTPETVPFRLTQDMVAGLGASGVEGVFTRCCEKTMSVLRSNKDTLLTILEVLLCDPLYMWTISPRQAYTKQNLPVPSSTFTEISSGSGCEAERALLRVSNKLEGTEFGSTLATPGQVARLIQQATDINNLSRLFPGWQPYL